MTKTKYIIPLLLASLILTGALCEDDDERRSKKSDEKDEYEDYLDYENESWKFAVKYPDDWEKEIFTSDLDKDFVIGFKSSRKDDSDTFSENVVILASVAQPQDFDELVGLGIEELANDESVNLISSSKIMVSGYPGYDARYSFNDGRINWEYIHYFINARSFWYQLLYTGQDDDFDFYLEKAEMIIDSLELF